MSSLFRDLADTFTDGLYVTHASVIFILQCTVTHQPNVANGLHGNTITTAPSKFSPPKKTYIKLIHMVCTWHSNLGIGWFLACSVCHVFILIYAYCIVVVVACAPILAGLIRLWLNLNFGTKIRQIYPWSPYPMCSVIAERSTTVLRSPINIRTYHPFFVHLFMVPHLGSFSTHWEPSITCETVRYLLANDERHNSLCFISFQTLYFPRPFNTDKFLQLSIFHDLEILGSSGSLSRPLCTFIYVLQPCHAAN